MEAVNKGLAAVLVLVAASAAAFFYGQHVENKALTAQHLKVLSDLDSTHAKALALAERVARQDEMDAAMRASVIDKSLLEKKQNEIISKDRIISGLRTGAVQLRQRFTCDASASGPMSATATSASISDAGTAGGLQKQDAEFFIQLAADADDVVLQLQACQALVKSDRGQYANH